MRSSSSGSPATSRTKKYFLRCRRWSAQIRLNVPVVGVSRTQWTTEQLVERVRKSIEEHGGVDPVAFPKLASLLRYVCGEYGNPATFPAPV
jgi:glucose-6-phosphate 1-dehydrogenase